MPRGLQQYSVCAVNFRELILRGASEMKHVARAKAFLTPTRLLSLAENSRKPPFSRGLQTLLELLLHKIGVPRVSQRVHETDAVSQKQFDKTIVHGVHAVLSADLNQSRYLRKAPGPDTRLDSRVHRQQFGGQD